MQNHANMVEIFILLARRDRTISPFRAAVAEKLYDIAFSCKMA